MKIWIDGIIRDMTPEEEAAWIKDHENLPDYPDGAYEEAKAEAFDIMTGVSE